MSAVTVARYAVTKFVKPGGPQTPQTVARRIQEPVSKWRELKMARQPRTFYYDCPHCGHRQNVNCTFCGKTYIFDPTKRPNEKWVIKKIRFGELQWQRLVARAKVTPAVEGPAELIRLMCDECLAMPPVRLISS